MMSFANGCLSPGTLWGGMIVLWLSVILLIAWMIYKKNSNGGK